MNVAMYQDVRLHQDNLTEWLGHDGVPEPLITQAIVMSEKEGEAALKLRSRFMRPSYVPREDPDEPREVHNQEVIEGKKVAQQSHLQRPPRPPPVIVDGTVLADARRKYIQELSPERYQILLEQGRSACSDDSDSDNDHDIVGPSSIIPGRDDGGADKAGNPISAGDQQPDLPPSDLPPFDPMDTEAIQSVGDQRPDPPPSDLLLSDPMDMEAGPSHPISPHFVHDEHDSDSDDELAFPDPATTDFPISLSHELVELSPNDEIQFAAIRTLERIKRQRQLITSDSDTSNSSEDEILEWEQYSDEEQEEAVEHGKKLVMRYGDQPVEDLDAQWFLMVFLDHFPNCQGLPPPGVSIKRWLKHLVLRHGSLFQRADFVCAAGDWLLRHGVNLAAFLQFKSSPDQFHMANRATSEDVERTAKLLARGARPNNDDVPEVKALFSQVQAVASRTPGSPYNAMVFRRHLFAGSVHFGAPAVFFTINPLETRSPFCWKLAGGENELYHYPLPGSNPPEIDDWEMIQLVRKRPMAQAIFFREVISAFLEVACGFKGVAVYSQSVDDNGRALGFFGALDRVNMKVEESGRLAQHAHGLLGSRFFKLHNITDVMDSGSGTMMQWMGSIAKCVMGSRIVALAEDGITPLTKQPTSYTQGVQFPDQLINISRRKRSHLLSTLLPRVDLLSPDAAAEEMEKHMATMKHSLILHEHSSRCIPKVPGGKGDDKDCTEGFCPGPDIVKVGTWNSDTQELRLPRDRTKLISHAEFALLAEKCNLNFVFIGDLSAREPMPGDEKLPLAEFCKRVTFYCSKYGSKIDAHQGEQLILNLLAAQIRTANEESSRPKILITRCANALHK